MAKKQASCDESQDARQPSPRTALPPRMSLEPPCPFVHVTLVTISLCQYLFSGQSFTEARNLNCVGTSNPFARIVRLIDQLPASTNQNQGRGLSCRPREYLK